MNPVQIVAGPIGSDQKLAAPALYDRIGIGDLSRLHQYILNRDTVSIRQPALSILPPEGSLTGKGPTSSRALKAARECGFSRWGSLRMYTSRPPILPLSGCYEWNSCTSRFAH